MYRSPLVSNDRLRGLATESTTTCNAALFPSVVAPARAPGAAASRSVVTNARAERLCITEFLSFKRGSPRSCGERALSWWRIGGGTISARKVAAVQYRVLDPIVVEVDGCSVEISTRKERTVKAALLVSPNRVVPVDRRNCGATILRLGPTR